MAQGNQQTWVRVVLAALALAGASAGRTQQTPSSLAAPAGTASQVPAAKDDNRTEKQRLLASEAQILVAMATELKVEVDKTNKNILSLNVVRKAEQIEALAHRMKDESKK